MKYSLIFAVVAGIITLVNGFLADYISPAFKVPESVATEVTESIVKATEKEKLVTVSSMAKVVNVIDGDTIEVEFNEGERALVRYIGVDTPERGRDGLTDECYYQEATNKNKELVSGKEVRLEKDVSEIDQYGRLLRYVFVGEEFVNVTLLEGGFGEFVSYPPDVAKAKELSGAALAAEAKQLGLWQFCK